MPFVVSVPAERIKQAGEVARRVELRRIRLAGFNLDVPDVSTTKEKGQQGRGLSLKLHVKPKLIRKPITRNSLSASVTFRAIAIAHRKLGQRAIAQWSAAYHVEYAIVDPNYKPKVHVAEAFVETNVLVNCWPYWREFSDSIIHRIGLPPLQLPLLFIAPTPTKHPRQ